MTVFSGRPIRAADPWQIAWTARVFGGPRPALDRARVLDIGCGDGAHALAIAAHHPEWQIAGVDVSPEAIEIARASAVMSELHNLRLEVADIAEHTPAPEHDFVVAHGVYSWIDAERRAQLLKQIRNALAPDGLAYVSFNALPGWGVRGRVREILMRHTNDAASARALVDSLPRHMAGGAWGELIVHELALARDADDVYLEHEYLAPHNEAFWIADFVRDAEKAGLRWIGDSQFDLREGRGYEDVRSALEITGLRGEELADLIGYRQLRCAVLARADAPSDPPIDPLAEAIVSGVISATSDPFRLEAEVEEIMRSPDGIEVRVRDPLAKMALLELARIYPDGLSIPDLVERARGLAARYGNRALDDTKLRQGILQLYKGGALEMRLGRARMTGTTSERPRASAFTRREAQLRPFITSALLVSIPLEPEQRAIVAKMDGSRSSAELGDPSIAVPTIELLARWGLAR